VQPLDPARRAAAVGPDGQHLQKEVFPPHGGQTVDPPLGHPRLHYQTEANT